MAVHQFPGIDLLKRYANVLKGLAVRGATAQNDADATAQAVSDWLSGLGM